MKTIDVKNLTSKERKKLDQEKKLISSLETIKLKT
tara:strand:+ start:670 stop:774 length:105 start_codon:yes stop_codon:yes gene_type:complete